MKTRAATPRALVCKTNTKQQCDLTGLSMQNRVLCIPEESHPDINSYSEIFHKYSRRPTHTPC